MRVPLPQTSTGQEEICGSVINKNCHSHERNTKVDPFSLFGSKSHLF